MNYIENKTVLITGASSGIGQACAIEFAKMRSNLILIARNADKLNNVKQTCVKYGVNVETFILDVSDKKEVFSSFKDFIKDKKIDILINNAGLALGLDLIQDGDIEEWDTMIDTNIKGVLYITKLLLPNMIKLDTAHIVNIGSVAGIVGYPRGNIYCMTKAAIKQLGQCLNSDLLGTNVKCTTIAPGAVETNFSNVRFKNDLNKANKVYEGYTPLYAIDIAETIINVVNTKPSVNIQYLDIMPLAQRNPYLIDKKI